MLGKGRRRIDIARGANRGKHIRLFQMGPDRLHPVGHLAEPDDIGARGLCAADRADIMRRHDHRRRPARLATRAQRPGKRAMHLQHRAAARRLVQGIDILGHKHHLTFITLLQAGQGYVRRIWRDLGRLRAARIVEPMHKVGIALKGFGRCDILDPVLGPKTAFVAKRRDPAFGRYSGACQNDDLFHFVPLAYPAP